MPDLSHKAVHQFWYDYNDKMIYRVISFMEGVEQWSLDGDPAVEDALLAFGEALDTIGGVDLEEQDEFIKVLGQLRTGRTLRLLQCLDTANPGSASKILIHSEESSNVEDDPAGFFLRRNIVFERLRLLGRVFSKERFALILKALEGDDE